MSYKLGIYKKYYEQNLYILTYSRKVSRYHLNEIVAVIILISTDYYEDVHHSDNSNFQQG